MSFQTLVIQTMTTGVLESILDNIYQIMFIPDLQKIHLHPYTFWSITVGRTNFKVSKETFKKMKMQSLYIHSSSKVGKKFFYV